MLDEAISFGSRCIKLKTGSGDLGWDETCIQLAPDEISAWSGCQRRMDARSGCANSSATRGPWCCLCRAACLPGRLAVEELRIADRLKRRIPPLVADESLQSQEDFAAFYGDSRMA